ncbi:unnamed protein product [Bemisia tabaci]|uniref:Uncharacterized protein n=1 Tax=Bemisia tabaci TaxID=7038 RepID=A0A9P0AIX4_BEMTA|nr:unnamed protein product [Bemisia tabaci]
MKAIYSLKIYLFTGQFELSESELKGICDVCVFIVKVYTKTRFTSTRSVKAPQHDIEFLQILSNYRKIDPVISVATLSNLTSHLWYPIPEAAAFSFFDRDISVECKRKMVTALSEENPLEDGEKKTKLRSAEDISGKDVSNFISCSSYRFFERFHLSSNFLKEDPSTWLANPQYLKNREIVKKIKVVNDTAERGVKLFEEYSQKLTKSDEERQPILQVVSDYRKAFPNVKKSTLRKKL